MAHPLLKISLFIYIKTISYLLKQKRWLILVTSGMELTTCFKNIPMQNTIPENITAAKAKVKIVVIIFILFNINTVISIFSTAKLTLFCRKPTFSAKKYK